MVKEGYKDTEVGLIPETWSVNSLHEHLLLLTDYDANGSFADMASNVKTTWGNGFAWFVRATDLEQKSEMSEVKYTDKTSYEFLKKSALFGKELLVAKRGEIGKVYYFQMKTQYATLGPNLYLLKLKETLNSNFLYWFFLSEIGQEKLKEINASTSLGAIYKDDVKKLKVPIPPLCEQQKIAEALSDMDNLISSLEKLIEKKKSIKQGAMQELLTGKKRLSGFNGEWTKINLAKKSKIKARIGWQGLTTAEYLDSGYSYLVTGTDFKNGFIDWDGCHYVEKNRFDQDKNIQIQNDDILITKDGSLGKVAYVSGLSKPATLNSGVFVIRPIQNAYDTRFVYYVLSSFVFKDFLDQLSAGSTIIHLYQKDMNKFEFYIPDDIKEQKAIANILFDMDAEITALEQKLAKCQKLKQGMMQQLLTGKIRLA